MSKSSVRVILPTNIYAFLGLVQRLTKKHEEEGPASPLTVLNKVSWEEVENKRKQCFEVQQRAEALRLEMEQLTEEKNQLRKELLDIIRASRGILLSVNAQNPEILGEWGFEVSQSPSKSAKKMALTPEEAGEED